jgi:PAS domain S-box-containing protein
MGFLNVRPLDEHLLGSAAHRALLDESPVAVLAVDPDSDRIVWSSQGALILLDVSREALQARTLEQLLGDHAEPWRRLRQEQTRGVLRLQGTHQRDGRTLHLQLLVRLAQLEGRTCWVVAIHDVSERVHLRQELACSDERFVMVSHATSDMIWDWDMSTGQLSWGGANHPLGYDPSELNGPLDQWSQLIHPEDRQRVVSHLHQSLDEGIGQWKDEYRFRRKDGSYAHILDRGFIVRDHNGKVCRMVGAMTDISPLWEGREALRRLNEALAAQSEERRQVAAQRANQLREVRREMVQIEQRERQRLARVLHDHLQQLLVAARMRLDVRCPNATTSCCQFKAQAIELLDQAIQEARSLSTELFPAVLQKDGFALAMNWLAEWMADKHHLLVELEVQDPAEPPTPETRATVFHTVRELLFNVVKHAGVNVAYLRVWPQGEQVHVEVRDQGRGFDPQQAHQDHFGLSHLRQRLELIGGSLRLQSAVDHGTHVFVTLPIDVQRPRPET